MFQGTTCYAEIHLQLPEDKRLRQAEADLTDAHGCPGVRIVEISGQARMSFKENSYAEVNPASTNWFRWKVRREYP